MTDDSLQHSLAVVKPPKHKEHLLGQFVATAVAGNDLLSSLLFTTGLTAYYAGYYAPLCLFLVCCVLFLFKT